MVRIISSVKFSALFTFSFLILSQNLVARESFEFDLGQKVNILSDKAFRRASENEFEAVGNVVITNLNNSIYGEKARVNFTSGETEVEGNVRYIAPGMTLYGTKLNYNFLTKTIDLSNARVVSDNFIVTGKKIIQTNPEFIEAEEAEYTTCKDCPESWSVFAKKISIEIGQYVRLKHAFIKINGVTAMYFPYLIFPIKQKRETGVLFPYLGFSSSEGFKYRQPFFWVIDDYKDMTLTPSTFGDRGLGGDIQYRQNIKEKTWFELNSLQLNDRIYEPNKIDKSLSEKKTYRQFSDLEAHYVSKNFFNGHLYFTNTSDLDTLRDLDFFTRDRFLGTEVGGGGFLEGRSSLFSFGVESYYNQNMLINDPKKFDDQYVQILPKISFNLVPYSFIHTDYPLLKNVSMGLHSDFTIFKQNKVDPTGPIRNARRTNLSPYIDWQLGNIGPVLFSHHLKLDYQSYDLPTESTKRFSKKGLIYETEAKIELERVYGLSYIEEKPVTIEAASFNNKMDASILDIGGTNQLAATTIGTLPKIRVINDEQTTLVYNNSYRHSQEYKLKHYYLGEPEYKGNSKFYEQIQTDNGQFDYLDALRDREYISNQTTAQASLPLSNTIEIQWNNNLIRKTSNRFDPYKDNRYLKDNFSYTNITYFDVSQGVDLNNESDQLVDRLTRLYINAGVTLDRLSFSIQEFYFHKSSEHKFTSTAALSLDRFSIGTNFTYNSFNSSNTPVTKIIGSNLTLNLNDLVTLKNSLDYNIESKLFNKSSYSILYAPLNDCWKLEFNYTRDLIDRKFGLLVYINYNANNFTSINVR